MNPDITATPSGITIGTRPLHELHLGFKEAREFAERILASLPPDDKRQSGRTTRKMKDAPRNAIYVWCNSSLDYPHHLARHIGRSDLRIISPQTFTVHFAHAVGFSEFVIDHATVTTDVIARTALAYAERKRATQDRKAPPSTEASKQAYIDLGIPSDVPRKNAAHDPHWSDADHSEWLKKALKVKTQEAGKAVAGLDPAFGKDSSKVTFGTVGDDGFLTIHPTATAHVSSCADAVMLHANMNGWKDWKFMGLASRNYTERLEQTLKEKDQIIDNLQEIIRNQEKRLEMRGQAIPVKESECESENGDFLRSKIITRKFQVDEAITRKKFDELMFHVAMDFGAILRSCIAELPENVSISYARQTGEVEPYNFTSPDGSVFGFMADLMKRKPVNHQEIEFEHACQVILPALGNGASCSFPLKQALQIFAARFAMPLQGWVSVKDHPVDRAKIPFLWINMGCNFVTQSGLVCGHSSASYIHLVRLSATHILELPPLPKA